MQEAIAIFAIKDRDETQVYNTALQQYPVRFTKFHLGTFEATPYEYNEEIRKIVEYVKRVYGLTRYVVEMHGKIFVLFSTKPMPKKDIEGVMFVVSLQLGLG